MLDNKELSKQKLPANKFWHYLKKNGFSILMIIAFGIIILNPDAKSYLLKQLMVTGLFNAKIDQKDSKKVIQAKTDFNFSDEKGDIKNTSSLRGKVVFINFWASWCPPCRAEFPSIETLYNNLKNNPAIFFLTINDDNDFSTAKNYLDKEKFTIPFYKSNGNVPAEIYTGTLPTTIVLDKKGEIRFHHTGFANYASDEFLKQIEEMIKE